MDLYSKHSREYLNNQYVYPVISRRSEGLSLGINLSPGQWCNFDCIYCQVKRETKPHTHTIQLNQLKKELHNFLKDYLSKEYLNHAPLKGLNKAEEAEKCTLKDISFSGNGEPTLSPEWGKALDLAINFRQQLIEEHQEEDIKIILITNGTTLHAEKLQSSYQKLIENNGEIWVKLDASTQEEFTKIQNCQLDFSSQLERITNFSKNHPIVIQTMIFKSQNDSPSFNPLKMAENIERIRLKGGQIKKIQLYTIRRPTHTEIQIDKVDENYLKRLKSYLEQKLDIPVLIYK